MALLTVAQQPAIFTRFPFVYAPEISRLMVHNLAVLYPYKSRLKNMLIRGKLFTFCGKQNGCFLNFEAEWRLLPFRLRRQAVTIRVPVCAHACDTYQVYL